MALPMLLGLVASFTVLTAALTLGGITATQQELQASVDALVLTDALAMLSQPVQAPSPLAAAGPTVVEGNSALPIRIDEQHRGLEPARAVAWTQVRAVAERDWLALMGAALEPMTLEARARIGRQELESGVTYMAPQVMLVLDYSKSMVLPVIIGTTGSAFQTLVRSIDRLFGRDVPADFGAVMFSEDVLHAVAPGPGSKERILAILHDSSEQPRATLGNLGRAIESAANILASGPPDRRRYILVVSDGAPQSPPPRDNAFAFARAQATAAKNAGITVMTVEVQRRGHDTSFSDLLEDVASPSDDDPSVRLHVLAADDDALYAQIGELAANVHCYVLTLNTAVHGRLATRDPAFGYLAEDEGNGRETAVARVPNPSGDRVRENEFLDSEAFFVDHPRQQVFASPNICRRIEDPRLGLGFVVRYAHPKLECFDDDSRC